MPSSAYICKIAFRQLIIEMVIWWDSVTVSLLLLLFWNIVRNPKNSDCETSWLVCIWYDCMTLLVNTCCWKRIFCSVSSWNVFIVWESTKNILIYLLHLHFWRGSVWYCKFSFGHTMVFRYLAHKSSDLSILVDSQQWIPNYFSPAPRPLSGWWGWGYPLPRAQPTFAFQLIAFPRKRFNYKKNYLDLAMPSRLAAS